MKNAAAKVVYVGKAKNLRTRVRQYFRPGADARFFVVAGLLRRVLADIETIVVDNEKEALLLENHLIKRHQPRFNINLRDDKQYLVLRVDPKAHYPRVEVVRNIRDDNARYFGPYHSATSCRETLRTLNRHFRLRTCTDHVLRTRRRPCLQYQIKRCPGPCVFPVDKGEYAEQVEDVMLFLNGKSSALVSRLEQRMSQKAQTENYESAAQIRDTIRAIERTLAKQHVVQDTFVDQDVFGMWRDGSVVELCVLFVRAGKLVGNRSVRQTDQEFSDEEILTNFVQQYYASGTFVPEEVLVPVKLVHAEIVEAWLSSLLGRRVRLMEAKRGVRTRLLSLAHKNAEAASVSRRSRQQDTISLLAKLTKRLHLRRIPHRIECYDIAHIQGSNPVASRVVFRDGNPDRSLYRRFAVQSVANDDYAAMYEVLLRRIRRMNSQDLSDAWAQPDLIVVDGGKGQLRSCLAATKDAGWNIESEQCFDVIGLAKPADSVSGFAKPDRIFLRNSKDPIFLPPNTAELYLLARIRDEAHRFANTFHRQKRKKSMLQSALDSIPGVGAKRKAQLLRHFGTMERIKAASQSQLAAVSGINPKVAQAIWEYFAREEDA